MDMMFLDWTFAAMRCNELPVPVGGKIVYTDGTKSGSTAHIQCTDKYRLVGSPTLTCLDDGEWSDSEPHCEGRFWVRRGISPVYCVGYALRLGQGALVLAFAPQFSKYSV